MKTFMSKIFHKVSPENDLPSNAISGESTLPAKPEGSTPLPEVNSPAIKTLQEPLDVPQLSVGISQSVGIQRDHNEDTLFSLTTNLASQERNIQFGLYIIADGMGGHENGELASSLAVAELTSFIISNIYLPLFSTSSRNQNLSVQELLRSGVINAHQAIKKEKLGGGTTLTAALILGDQMVSAHVGDSRLYSIEPDGNIQLLTHDHTLVKRLEEIGEISAEQASSHPQRNVLYRALGQGDPFEADIAIYPCKPGNSLLLCSDGLWGLVTETDIAKVVLSTPDPQVACQILVQKANLAGGPDNISVIIVKIPGGS